MADIPTDFGADTEAQGSQEVEMEIDAEETLPISRPCPSKFHPPGKDSITVDMDMDELGLDLDSEDQLRQPRKNGTDRCGRFQIGEILEVQELRRFLMSKDLDLDSGLLSKQPIPRFDIIDLEDDTEIRDMDLEELESSS